MCIPLEKKKRECFMPRARRLSSKLLRQVYLRESLKSSFMKLYGSYGDLIQQYEVTLSRMLNDIRPLTSYRDFPTDQTFHQFYDTDSELYLHPITSGLHGTFATDVACQQEPLPFRTPGTVPLFGTYLCSNCWCQFSRTCRVFSRLFTYNTPRYFLDFAQ